MLASPELQTDAVRKGSQDLSPKSFPREKREPGRTYAHVFPSCILEVEGDAFRIMGHGDYSFVAWEPIRKDR